MHVFSFLFFSEKKALLLGFLCKCDSIRRGEDMLALNLIILRLHSLIPKRLETSNRGSLAVHRHCERLRAENEGEVLRTTPSPAGWDVDT